MSGLLRHWICASVLCPSLIASRREDLQVIIADLKVQAVQSKESDVIPFLHARFTLSVLAEFRRFSRLWISVEVLSVLLINRRRFALTACFLDFVSFMF